ncbi:hypothetical protein [Pedobacter sp. Hv1]|uniref:hypothetical protein n=1 Tax=Pedobacter sp. Hv1 TaxID=1740090 RepID=UPI0006D88E52|nr:hypothetical protein [Pedobacter sp. Hv1]KQB98617.1 hypothetical protein AQF98_21495 [Pedobacter sp. Hv1]
MEKILTYLLEGQSDFSGITNNETIDRLFNVKLLPTAAKESTAELVWMQLVNVVKLAKQSKAALFILGKNIESLKNISHTDLLLEVISDALDSNLKILVSNTSSGDATLIPLSPNLFWTDSLYGFEFLVIYESCFDLIINEDFSAYHTISECLENITSNKMLIYPMVNTTPNVNHQNIHLRMERLMQMSIYLEQNRLKLQKKKQP